MRNKIFLFSALLLGMTSNSFGQMPSFGPQTEPKQIIKLWDGKVPGAIENAEVQEENIGSRSFFVRTVVNPSLAYYPAEKNETGTAVVVCPGGGYAGLTYLFEGMMTADWLNSIGISAFVLRYRLPNDKIMEDRKVAPLQDVQQAIRYVRANAEKFGINPDHIGVMGFSAGGHLAATASTLFNEIVYKPELNVSARPDFSVLVYPVITMDPTYTHSGSREALIGLDADQATTDLFSAEKQVTPETPPAFITHALDDKLVPFINSINYGCALREKGVQCEMHLYAHGDHGLQTKAPTDTQSFWHDACEKWLRMNGWLK